MKILEEILGWIGFATTLSMLLPQLIKVIKTRNTRQLSVIMFVIAFANALTWFIYGILQKNAQIYGSNGVGLISSTTILIFVIYNKYHDDQPIKDKKIQTIKELKKQSKIINDNINDIKTKYINEMVSLSTKEQREQLQQTMNEEIKQINNNFSSFKKGKLKEYKEFKKEFEKANYPRKKEIVQEDNKK